METVNDFSLTTSAAKRIAFLAQTEPYDTVYLRIAVDPGGCSGMQYKYTFEGEKTENDTLIEHEGAKVIIDEVSMPFVSGSALDYVESLGAAHFEIKNPNATANCGCGNSFSV